MPKKILQKEAPILRKTALNVPVDSIKSAKIQKIIEEMKVAMASQDDGVAIAAPQIGYSLGIFIISKKVFEMNKTAGENPEEKPKNLIFINPKIIKVSKKKMVVEEGCLSVRYLYGKVERRSKATVEAYDQNGKKFTRGGTGLLAQIFQHEVDHLNGVLFIDKAKYVEEILPEHLIPAKKDAKK